MVIVMKGATVVYQPIITITSVLTGFYIISTYIS